MKRATKASTLKADIHYTLPNKQRIELLSEMRIANFDFGDFDEPIKEVLKAYSEATEQTEKKTIEQKIAAQCSAFADFLGIQDEEIRSMMMICQLP